MTKAELINDVVYEMAGYLTPEGIDHLKTVITFKLVNINLTATETLPSTNVYDNEWIMERYIIDLTATGRKRSTIKLYITIIKKFFLETGLNYHTCTGQDVMDYIATRLHKDKISKSYASTIQKYMSSFFAWAYRKSISRMMYPETLIKSDSHRREKSGCLMKRLPEHPYLSVMICDLMLCLS